MEGMKQVRWVGLVFASLVSGLASGVNGQIVARQTSGSMPTASVPAAVSGSSISAGVQLPSYDMIGFGVSAPGAFAPFPAPVTWTMTPGGWMPTDELAPAAGRPWPPSRALPAPARPAVVRAPAPLIRGEQAAQPVRDPVRAEQLAVLGDRHFRAGDLKRAESRYEQALASDPGSSAIRVRLSQIALVRKDYALAAGRLVEAQATDPNWLERPFDVQKLYPEPARFAQLVADLELHVQQKPEDRDAWLMLGAVLYLSNRPGAATDIFARLHDRKPDPVLAAFLDATAVEAAAPAPADVK